MKEPDLNPPDEPMDSCLRCDGNGGYDHLWENGEEEWFECCRCKGTGEVPRDPIAAEDAAEAARLDVSDAKRKGEL